MNPADRNGEDRNDEVSDGEERAVDEVFESLVVAYSDALAAGVTPTVADETNIPLERLPHLRSTQACLSLLDQARRARQPADSQIDAGFEPASPELALGLPQVNGHIGHFQILRELGRGGYGVVFLAFDTRLKRQVALKVPRPEVLVTRELSQRFMREARAAGSLAHPNLVTVYEVGADGPLCFIASAYCDGPNMAQWLMSRTESVPPRQAAELLAALADGVESAHLRGILHRDIKPSNVLLEPHANGARGSTSPTNEPAFNPKLTDFGLARLQECNGQETRSGALLGTPSYMAPEQATGRLQDVGRATDVYALGTILYELLTGQQAFQGINDLDTLRRVVENAPEPIRRLRPGVPRDLQAICLKCMDARPERRYPTAALLAADLRRFLSGTATLARPLSPAQSLLKWSRRRPALAGLLGVSVAASLTLILLTAVYVERLHTANQTAETLRAESQVSAAEAETQATVANQFLYAARMKLAYQSLEQGGFEQAQGILTPYERGGSLADLRGFEWYHLERRLHGEQMSLTSHHGEVYAVAFSPDGRLLVSGGQDGKLFFWDPTTGQQMASISAHASCVNVIAYSPDGSIFATGSCDHTIKLWDAATHKLLDTLEGHPDLVANLAFSPTDARLLASCGNDPFVRIWDLSTREVIASLDTRGQGSYGLTWQANGKALYIASMGTPDVPGGVVFWDVENNRSKVHGWSAHCLASSAVTGDVCIGHTDTTIRKLGGGNAETVLLQGDVERVESLAFSPRGERLASGSQGTIRIWDTQRNVCRQTLTGHMGRVQSLAFSPRGLLLASAGFDGTVKIWDLADSDPRVVDGQLHFFVGPHTNPKRIMAFSSDLRYFVSETGAKQATVVDLKDGSRVGTLPLAGETKGLCFLADRPVLFGLRIQSATIGELWDVEQWKSVGSYPVSAEAHEAKLSGDGRHLAMISRDAVNIMDTTTSRTWSISDQPLHSQRLGNTTTEMIWSPDQKRLGIDLGIEAGWIVDLEHSQSLRVSRAWLKEITDAGQWFVVGESNRSLVLIEPDSGRTSAHLRHGDHVGETSLTPDARTLAVHCDDGSVYLWSTSTGQEITRLKIDKGTCAKLQFSADGRQLAAVIVTDSTALTDGARLNARVFLWNALDRDEQIPAAHARVTGDSPHPAAFK